MRKSKMIPKLTVILWMKSSDLLNERRKEEREGERVIKKHTDRWWAFALLNVREKFVQDHSKAPNVRGDRELALGQ